MNFHECNLNTLEGLLTIPPAIPGEVKLDFTEKSISLLDQISRILYHQFVTWYLRIISRRKLWNFSVRAWVSTWFISKMPQMLPKCYTKVSQMWSNKKLTSKEIPTIEKYMLSIICVLLNTKFHNTSENFYFNVILVQDPVLCEVTNMTNSYMNFILDLDRELNFQRAVCLDSNKKHYYQSKICW